MSNTSDIEEGEIPDQETLAIPPSSKNFKNLPKKKPERPYDSDSSASSEQASSEDSDNEWWERKKVKGDNDSEKSNEDDDSDVDIIESTTANPNYFKKDWKHKRDDPNSRKGFHKKKQGYTSDKFNFKRKIPYDPLATKANVRRSFPPGSPPKAAMYPCRYYIAYGKCDDPNCKNVHAPLTREEEMQRFITENEDFFADIAKRRNELTLSPFLQKMLTDKFGPLQPQLSNPPPNFPVNRPLPPPKTQPAPFHPPSQGPPPMGNFNSSYPPPGNFQNMPPRPGPGMPHQSHQPHQPHQPQIHPGMPGPVPGPYNPPQNAPQPMHNMPPQDPRFGQNMPPRNPPGFDYQQHQQPNFSYQPPVYRPQQNQMYGNQYQQEPKFNMGPEQQMQNPGMNPYQANSSNNNFDYNMGPHGVYNPYQQPPPGNMNPINNRGPGGPEEQQPGYLNPQIGGSGAMGMTMGGMPPQNVGPQGNYQVGNSNYQPEQPRFGEPIQQGNRGNIADYPPPQQQQQQPQYQQQQSVPPQISEGNVMSSQGMSEKEVKASSPVEVKKTEEPRNEGEKNSSAMADIQKFNEKMKSFGIFNVGGGATTIEKDKEKEKADSSKAAEEELQRQIKEAIREETKGVDGGSVGNISINDQILKQIKSVLPQFQSQSPDNIKNLVNMYLKLSKDPRLQNRIQS